MSDDERKALEAAANREGYSGSPLLNTEFGRGWLNAQAYYASRAVPREPTAAMLEAASIALAEAMRAPCNIAVKVWAAMYAATDSGEKA